ncbi:hypothetical protein FGO68_gene702 [Halteria grandinella]|uniref:Uncharacterized protein n=1 Tax=Halteria grandinella TaxID=5974 RepID=A0A8J8SZ43_HALGN|nr:hypothetical protein FGO68_gene702 [Halteria grandinella]
MTWSKELSIGHGTGLQQSIILIIIHIMFRSCLLQTPTVTLSNGHVVPLIINSGGSMCPHLDWSIDPQNPKNVKSLEEDYKHNLLERPVETAATLAAIRELRFIDGSQNCETWCQFVAEYGPQFEGVPIKGLLMQGFQLGRQGGQALLAFIRRLDGDSIKCMNLSNTGIPADLMEQIN